MAISIEKQVQVGLIYVDNPPVNAISESVASGIIEAIETLESDPVIRVVVLTARGRTFVAGADVRKFEQMIHERICHLGAGLYDVTNRIEQCKKPVVCAMFGTTLGGGLELAMSCHYRIADVVSALSQDVSEKVSPGALACRPDLLFTAPPLQYCALVVLRIPASFCVCRDSAPLSFITRVRY